MGPNRCENNKNPCLQATVLQVSSKANVADCVKVFCPPWHLSQFSCYYFTLQISASGPSCIQSFFNPL